MKKELSVFIPIFNEEKTLYSNIIKVYEYCRDAGYKFELIIIDDGSTDRSLSIIEELTKKYKDIKYFSYGNGPSRRENLAKSFKKGNGDIIVFMDADLSTELKCLKSTVGAIESGFDIAIGSRYLKKSNIKRTFFRHSISRAYNLFIRLYFNSVILDHQCGFKAFKRNVILDLIETVGYKNSLERGWFWDVEILIHAQKKRYNIKEVPVEWKEVKHSSFKLFEELKMIPYIFSKKF